MGCGGSAHVTWGQRPTLYTAGDSALQSHVAAVFVKSEPLAACNVMGGALAPSWVGFLSFFFPQKRIFLFLGVMIVWASENVTFHLPNSRH